MSMSGRILKGLTSPIGLAPLLAGSLLLLLVAIESRAQPPRDADTSTVRGKVERFTTAPMGETDGAMLDDGTWLHWPPHLQDRFASILKKGDRVRATCGSPSICCRSPPWAWSSTFSWSRSSIAAACSPRGTRREFQ